VYDQLHGSETTMSLVQCLKLEGITCRGDSFMKNLYPMIDKLYVTLNNIVCNDIHVLCNSSII